MHSITFSKSQEAQIDVGIQIEFERFGFTLFAVADESGDFVTRAGTRFMIGFYNPTEYDMEVKFR